MVPRCPGRVPLILPILPFLYPSACLSTLARNNGIAVGPSQPPWARFPHRCHMTSSSSRAGNPNDEDPNDDRSRPQYPTSHLNPAPDDYASVNFADKAALAVHAGPGGHGCISFLRELYLPEGPPNGGDGGHGGNVYIQAVPGETSLHKLARKRVIRAGRGKHGQGSARNGPRGDDVIISVPVGTVVTEVSRVDPVAEEVELARERYHARKWRRKMEMEQKANKAKNQQQRSIEAPGMPSPEQQRIDQQKKADIEADDAAELAWIRRKWVVYPGLSAAEARSLTFPRLPRRDRLVMQPPGPIYLDLSRPTKQPILLAAGGVGGLGNPHFAGRDSQRPVVATKGEAAVSLTLEMELKLLADVGLVGLPNAGKSTLLRALSNSRTRVGAWAFTTLQPNVGTVVLDNHRGRPVVLPSAPSDGSEERRTRFTVADIPGLIEGAHLDKGLGIAFLRHVERAGVLAFVIDLGAGNAVAALRALWNEVGLYAQMREDEERQRERENQIDWTNAPLEDTYTDTDTETNTNTNTNTETNQQHRQFAPSTSMVSPEVAIAGKPWFVVATKADLPNTQANFEQLNAYLYRVMVGDEPHPSGLDCAWTDQLAAIPVSAINGEGVQGILNWTVGLLDAV